MRWRLKKTVKIVFRVLGLSEIQVTAMQTNVAGAKIWLQNLTTA